MGSLTLTALIVLNQMLVLFILMMVGSFCYKKQYITPVSFRSISSLVVNIFNPLLIVSGVLEKSNPTSTHDLISLFIIASLMFLYFIIVSPLLHRILRIPQKQRPLYTLITIFCNTGFIGLPIAVSLFGKGITLYVAVFILVYNLLFYTYGIYVIEKTIHDNVSLFTNIKSLLNPGVIACIAAIIIFIFQIKLPSFLTGSIDFLGSTSIPLSMMMVGVSLSQTKLKTLLTDIRLYAFSFIKLLLMPALFIIILQQFTLSPLIIGASIIMVATPVGNMPTLLASEYGIDGTVCSNGLIITTLLSLFTIPIIAGIFL